MCLTEIKSGKDKGVQQECLALGNNKTGQYFMQDYGQGHCNNNATSGQYFNHDCIQGNPKK